MNKTINDIKARIGDAEHKLGDLQRQLNQECEKALSEKHGLHAGDIIASDGKRYQFAGFYRPASLGWVTGNLIKKDGTPSAVVKIMYGKWTKESTT